MKGPFLSVLVSAVMLTGIGLAGRERIDKAAVERYHQSVKAAAGRFPLDFGSWTGHEVELPPSATQLLRPNAIVAREYQTREHGGVSVTLMLVQCADTRDMQGHYPPNCYPAHGWEAGGMGASDIEEGAVFGSIPAARYDFFQQIGDDVRRIRVYNLFVLPSGATTTSMDEVREASADYQVRPYGAAQVQVLLDGAIPESEDAWVLDQMRAIAEPVMQCLLAGASEHREGAEE